MRSTRSAQIAVKVVCNYDGFRGEVVETIKRKPTNRGGYSTRGPRVWNGRTATVSYKGERHDVVTLPAVYGNISGAVIIIARAQELQKK